MANGPGYAKPAGGGASAGDAALQMASDALEANRLADAERLAGGVLNANPRHPRALHIFGCAVLMQGRAKEAIAPLKEAARGRHDPKIDTHLAVALRQAGHNNEALSRLKLATKRQPPHAAAFHELGYLLFSMERYDEAIEALNRGIEAAPMVPDLSIQLGYIYLQRNNHAGAKSAFARALAIVPDSPDALFGMGMAQVGGAEYQSAAESFRRSLRRRPEDAGTWFNLGHCLLVLGQLDDGYECFRAAARGDARRYGHALTALVKSGRGRFWLRPSDAARFLLGAKN